MQRYVLLEKAVGETPLQCAEAWRVTRPEVADMPLAYAGRLDPMASGSLLVLIGDECKVQAKYHNLDKAYSFDVLLGISSDSGDVLGLVTENNQRATTLRTYFDVAKSFVGPITLPYPAYSARTVHGKPLHEWASEGRLHEITIPHKTSRVYKLSHTKTRRVSRADLYREATAKIASLPTVTDPRKAIGNDFRRKDVYESWDTIVKTGTPSDEFTIASFNCIASSGTYMRTLAEEIAKKLGTTGLAFKIHRTTIGIYQPLLGNLGFWSKRYTNDT